MTTTTDQHQAAKVAGAQGAGARVASWPLLLLAAPAFVAIWSGWVGLGDLTGFGVVHPLPGIADGVTLNTAITLPIGVETYAAYALKVWLTSGPDVPEVARRFAHWSALGSLILGAAGQVAYHLMTAAGMTTAPWQITAAVACLPVVVLGMGAALAHLVTAAPQDAPDVAEGVPDAPEGAADVRHGSGTAGDDSQPSQAVPTRSTAGQDVPRTSTHVSRPRPGKRAAVKSGGDTASRVARLRERHPDLTTAQIARRLGVTDRTVRRHLATPTGDTGTARPAVDQDADTGTGVAA